MRGEFVDSRHTNRSWRVDETYVKVSGNWAYLYRSVDSAGETIEFMLSPKRNLIAAKLFLRLALSGGNPSPRVINVDGHVAYVSAIAELTESGELGRRCRCRRTAPYLNNIIEQDHRFIKKRISAKLGFRSEQGGVANDRVLRGDARNPQRASPLGSQGRSCSSASVHPHNLRCRCLALTDTPACPHLRSRHLQQNPLGAYAALRRGNIAGSGEGL